MRPVFILGIILLLVGCKQRDERVLMVDEQGSFAVGGTVLVDSLGHTFHGDHAYVFYQKPVGARKYPLVFAHGVGQFSKTWETTPDGREGFQNIFLRRRFSVYLVDQPRRGNAGRGTESVTISPAFDEEVWFNRFRVGIWPDYFEGVQFKRAYLLPIRKAGPLDGIHCLRRETLRLSRHTNRVERFLFRKGNCRRRLSLLRFPRKWKALKYLCPYSWNIPRSLSSFIMEIIYPKPMSVRSYMNGHAVCA